MNEIEPISGKTLALDGKVLRVSYLLETDNPQSQPHKAITLVSAYLVERGLILQPCEVKEYSNEITAIPEFIKVLAVKGVVFAFDSMNTQKAVRPRSGLRGCGANLRRALVSPVPS